MSPRPSTVFVATSLTLCWACLTHAQQIEAHFSPDCGTAKAIIARIDSATKSIDVAAYQLTHPGISNALIAAHMRRVSVRLLVDRSQETSPRTTATYVSAAGVDMRTDHRESIMHNKFMVIDSATVITGSFNFTVSADQKNAENCLFIVSADLAAQYAHNFSGHWHHSHPYASRHNKR